MSKFIYNLFSLVTLLKIILKSFKVLHNSHLIESEDITLESRDLLICWTIYTLLYLFAISGFERIPRWIPGYYYFKSFLLIIVAFPQLRIARILFFEFIKPTVEYLHQISLQFGIDSPLKAVESIPFIILALIFPGLASNKPVNERVDATTQNEIIINSELSQTSRKLSVLTEHLDELGLRGSPVKYSKDKTSVDQNNDPFNETKNDVSDVVAQINIHDNTSKEKTPTKHNRRRSLVILQDVIQKQIFSTLRNYNINPGSGGSRSSSRSRSRTRSRSGSRSGTDISGKSEGKSSFEFVVERPSSRPRISRRPSKDNLLLMDPIKKQPSGSSRSRRIDFYQPIFSKTNKSTPFVPSTATPLPPDIQDIFTPIDRPQSRVKPPVVPPGDKEGVTRKLDSMLRGAQPTLPFNRQSVSESKGGDSFRREGLGARGQEGSNAYNRVSDPKRYVSNIRTRSQSKEDARLESKSFKK